MADTRKDLPNPSRRAVLEAGGALLGANFLSAATAPLAMADLAQPSLPAVTIGHRLHQLGYHAAYQGKWHLSGTLDTAHQPIDAPLLKYREVIESYGFDDFMGLG